ncbi:alpha/beta fold hydrolase [Rhizobium sullae]|uniref:alpha/beta fold hydrolase n=1 Tax=Rhizobium sullae TaxID=50338 RepID=UPI0018E27F06|nr:alpha/beta fold hydrolase [Rhizobium sullae]
MSRASEEMINGSGGKLFVRSWLTESAPRAAVVAICHGFNAHSGMHQWAGQQLSEHGLSAFAVDLRGRGRSEGERFYTTSIDDYVQDGQALIALAKVRHRECPIFLLGHRAGGVTSCIYALDYEKDLAGRFAKASPSSFPLLVLRSPRSRR